MWNVGNRTPGRLAAEIIPLAVGNCAFFLSGKRNIVLCISNRGIIYPITYRKLRYRFLGAHFKVLNVCAILTQIFRAILIMSWAHLDKGCKENPWF